MWGGRKRIRICLGKKNLALLKTVLLENCFIENNSRKNSEIKAAMSSRARTVEVQVKAK